ncbi:unnamed protein product [Lymnaea stagnalis]|uniref:Cyclic nucleotide-binding domain-containing protein n=1 Tax=Lymnaea stagnalis TaxID=6523 RepID=A0AAV2HQB0_LYMST
MSSFEDRLVGLISSPPEERRDVDIELAVPWLRKKSQLLQSLDKDILRDVVKNCLYQQMITDEIIIRQGDYGDRFYVILTGRTSVYIDTVKSDDDSGNDVNRDDAAGEPHAAGDGIKAENKALDRTQFGKFITHFGDGQSFGEIALIRDDCVRNATVMADSECDLLVIPRYLYNTSIKTRQLAEYEEKRKFVETCTLFRGWSTKFRNLLEMSLTKETYPYGSTVVKQGAPTTGLIFIIGGQAKLTVEPSLHKHQYSKIMSRHAQTNFLQDQWTVPDTESGNHQNGKVQNLTSDQIFVRRRLGYAAAERRIRSKNIQVCCIEKGEVIGDTEMVLDLPTNTETAVTTAPTTVFVLNTKNYERLVTRKHPAMALHLAQWALNKIVARSKNSKAREIPLLRSLEAELREKLPREAIPTRTLEILKKKEVETAQLLNLYLQDKAPLIEPCVPNAMFFKQRSLLRNKELPPNALSRLRRFKDAEQPVKLLRKFPRSRQQLKNNIEAERELLRDDQRESADLNLRIRPATTIGFTRQQTAPAARERPKSALSQAMTIKEYLQGDGRCGRVLNLERCRGLDRESVVEIFEEMQQLREESVEHRNRIVKSASAKIRAKEKQHHFMNGDLQEDDENFDWETSEANLKDLEKRVARFCHSVGQVSNSSDALTASKGIPTLRRFQIVDPKSVPLPGGTVFVQSKLCQLSSPGSSRATSRATRDHHHVRWFILSTTNE